MLGNKKVIATVAVKDLKPAVRFYGETLGLKREGGDSDEAVTFSAGNNTTLIVYKSTYAGSNKATSVNWEMGSELDKNVKELEQKGVKFEDYDMPNMKRTGHVHVADGMKMAWFKDPDGNIHALMGR